MPTVLKYAGLTLLALVVAGALLLTIIPRFLDRIYYLGPESDHFDGERFFNPDGEDTALAVQPRRGGQAGFVWRQLTGSDGRPPWPERVAVAPSKPEPRVEGERMVATWIGHATVLVQTNGLNILTDPIWSERASPFGFVGPKRVAAPGVRFEDLPKIDLVLVSHNHYDHMDLPTLRRLWERDRPIFITSLGNDALLRKAGISGRANTTDCGRCPGVQAADWGVDILVEGVAMEAWKARPTGAAPIARVVVNRNHHWGSRWFSDRNRALWSSFVVSMPGSGSIFFAGDTGLGDGRWPIEAKNAALDPVRLALIPIGAFRFEPGQMASGSHIGPVDAVEVHRRLGAATSLPIHWGTFRLSYEAYDTPPKLLAEAMRATAQRGFAAQAIGRPVEVPPFASPRAPPAVPRAELLRRLDTDAVRAMR